MQESLLSPIYNIAVQKANCCGQPLIAIILWFTTLLVNFSSAMIHFWWNILEIGGHYSDFQICCGIATSNAFQPTQVFVSFLAHFAHSTKSYWSKAVFQTISIFMLLKMCLWMLLYMLLGMMVVTMFYTWMLMLRLMLMLMFLQMLMLLRRNVCKILLKQHGPNDIERCHAILFAESRPSSLWCNNVECMINNFSETLWTLVWNKHRKCLRRIILYQYLCELHT